jgi:hypothetical protein
VPELEALTKADKNLGLHCNQIGFTHEDVEGISDIGRSTKRATREKGIGFKSVFRLADFL